MENYLGILRVLGAASFGLGGIAFLLSFRWRMDGLKLVRHHIRWDASVITIIAISAALNAGAAIITGPIRFGWISFRPGAAITPVLGILFGIPGAIGAGLGNVISDILKGQCQRIFGEFLCICPDTRDDCKGCFIKEQKQLDAVYCGHMRRGRIWDAINAMVH